MKQDHEIDPGYADHLEWQLRTAYRRKERFARPMSTPGWRVARTAALVMMSVTLGAAGTLGAERLQSSSRRELLLARSEIRLEMTVAQLDLATREAARATQLFEAGVVPTEVPGEARLAVEDARVEHALRMLDRDEIIATDEEPRDDLGAPTVAGRDFVLERLTLTLENERRRTGGVADMLETTRERHALGLINSREVEFAELAYADARESIVELERRVEIRLSFLGGLIPPHQIDLVVMREAARSRLRRLQRQFSVTGEGEGFLSGEASRKLVELGYVTGSRMDSGFVRAELELAEIELKLIQDRLGVGAWEPAPRSEAEEAEVPVEYEKR